MTTIVRSLTPDEQETWRRVLEQIHAHIEECPQCAEFGDKSPCQAGRALYSEWADLLK